MKTVNNSIYGKVLTCKNCTCLAFRTDILSMEIARAGRFVKGVDHDWLKECKHQNVAWYSIMWYSGALNPVYNSN